MEYGIRNIQNRTYAGSCVFSNMLRNRKTEYGIRDRTYTLQDLVYCRAENTRSADQTIPSKNRVSFHYRTYLVIARSGRLQQYSYEVKVSTAGLTLCWKPPKLESPSSYAQTRGQMSGIPATTSESPAGQVLWSMTKSSHMRTLTLGTSLPFRATKKETIEERLAGTD